MARFLNQICLKLNVDLLKKDVEQVNEIINAGSDRHFLKLLREETTLLVLMVRVANQDRQEEWERQHVEKESEIPNLFEQFQQIEREAEGKQ